MPTAPVDDSGTVLYYEDTGPLPGPYTTLILIPGVGFNAPGIFAPLTKHAPSHSLRLVFLNRRDYPGSSPLPESMISDITSGDDLRRSEFYVQQAVEIARFTAWFARKEAVVPYTVFADGTRRGGIVIAGWSFGASVVIDILANANRIPDDTRAALSPYLRGICVIDTPHHVFGLTDPPGRTFYHPLGDTSIGGIERYSTFEAWASSYYPHLQPSDPTQDAHDIALLADASDALSDPPPTLLAMPEEARRASMWWRAQLRWEGGHLVVPFAGQWARTGRILEGAGSEGGARADPDAFPRASFVLLYGSHTLWESVYGAWKVSELHDTLSARGRARREFKCATIEGANHFSVWDMPEKFLDVLVRTI